MADDEQIKVIEITLWLGADQKVRINASKTLNKDPRDDADFTRSGFPAKASGKDLLLLVEEILTKLKDAFPKKEAITVRIEDDEIVASSPPSN